MKGELPILKNLNSELLKRIVIIVQLICVLFAVVVYYTFPTEFQIFGPWVMVVNLLTLVALPTVYKKLNIADKDEDSNYLAVLEDEQSNKEIDLWDRTVVGFYVFTNAAVILFIFLILLM